MLVFRDNIEKLNDVFKESNFAYDDQFLLIFGILIFNSMSFEKVRILKFSFKKNQKF